MQKLLESFFKKPRMDIDSDMEDADDSDEATCRSVLYEAIEVNEKEPVEDHDELDEEESKIDEDGDIVDLIDLGARINDTKSMSDSFKYRLIKQIQTASIDCTQYPKHVEYGKQRKFQGSCISMAGEFQET